MNKEKSTERRQSGGTMPKQLYGICQVQNHAFLSPDGSPPARSRAAVRLFEGKLKMLLRRHLYLIWARPLLYLTADKPIQATTHTQHERFALRPTRTEKRLKCF